MRNVVVVMMIASLSSFPAAARQARGSAASGGSGIKACSLLPKDLALKVSSANKAVFDGPPHEEPFRTGSTCNYGDITLHVDAFSWSSMEGMMKKDGNWTQVSGVGDAGYFRDNSGRNAEFMGRVGSRTFRIQLGIPISSTADKVKPNVITLANAIVPKLR